MGVSSIEKFLSVFGAQPAAASLQTFHGMKSASVYRLGARKEASLAAKVAARAVSFTVACEVCEEGVV